jgi:hypothetical protein
MTARTAASTSDGGSTSRDRYMSAAQAPASDSTSPPAHRGLAGAASAAQSGSHAAASPSDAEIATYAQAHSGLAGVANRAQSGSTAINAPVLQKPPLPTAPRKPDLRKVKDPIKRKAKVDAYEAAAEEYKSKKREYDEVLYPAYEKEYQRAYEQTEKRQRSRQLEKEASRAAAAVHHERIEEERRAAAAIQAQHALEEAASRDRGLDLCDREPGPTGDDLCGEGLSEEFPPTDPVMLTMMYGCLVPQQRDWQRVWDEEQQLPRQECISGKQVESPPKSVPSLRLLALESIEAQRDKSSPTWLDLDWTEYKPKGHSTSTKAYAHRFARCARGHERLEFRRYTEHRDPRGLPFTHPAWHALHCCQGQYLRERGLLVDAEREFKKAADMLHGSKAYSVSIREADERLSAVRKLRRERRYGMDREGNKVWRSGSAMAKRCRMSSSEAAAPPDASDGAAAGPSSVEA